MVRRICTVRRLARFVFTTIITAALGWGGSIRKAVAQDSPHDTSLTLARAVALAKERAPSVRLAFARVVSAEGLVQRAGAARLPTLSAAGGGTALVRDGQFYANGIVTSTVNQSFFAGQSSLSVMWPIYDFGRTASAVDAGEAGVRAARLGAEAMQHEAMAEIAVAFFHLLADSELVRAADEMRGQREQVLAITHRQVESGYRMPVDEIRAQVSLEEASLDLSMAEAARDSDSVTLSNALLLDPAAKLRLIAPGPLALGEKVAADIAAAMRDRRDVAASRERVEQARRGLDAARRAYLPLLAANATGTLVYLSDRSSRPGEPPTLTDGLTKLAVGGITLSVPIFDPLIDANKKVAEGTLREAEASLEQVSVTARSQTWQAVTQLRRARALLEQAQRLAVGAAASLTAIEERYATGIEGPLALAEAQRQDALGRVAVIRGRLAVNVAEVRMLASMARVDELLAAR